MAMHRRSSARLLGVGRALALAASLLTAPLAPLTFGPGGRVASGAPLGQEVGTDRATLETRQPTVQWSAAGATEWQAVPARQTVAAGDRVRTGAGASARLVYFEGTATEIGPDTGLLVQRLERSPEGNIVARLFQSAGTTLNRVVALVDPAASFEIETPAATALVRGTTPRVQVAGDGTSRIGNVPDGSTGEVVVQGKDANATRVTLQPGQESRVVPGQPPGAPSPISTQQSQQSQQSDSQEAQQTQQQQQAMAMTQAQQAQMVGQGMAASFAAAQSSFMNAAVASALMNQQTSQPNFPFSSQPVATGTVRLGR